MKKIDGLHFLDYLKEKIMILDGATGTYLQQNGMRPGVCPEVFALEHPQILREVQQRYVTSGSKALYTFTMGANAYKLGEYSLSGEVYRINKELAELSADAAGGKAFVGGDLSSTGSFLAPLGDLEFEQVVCMYKNQIKALVDGGVDFIVIETMIDIQETRAAVIAAKECCTLPVVASMTFDEKGRTLTGTSPAAAAMTLISAGADVVGLNCSTGPAEMLPLVKSMKDVLSVPLLVKPNAGMPKIVNGETCFDLTCPAFKQYVKPLCEAGANLIGGCCGTNPDYIRAVSEVAMPLKPLPWRSAMPVALSSVSDAVFIGSSLRVIGERINPTGKPKLKEALKTGDYYEVLDMALEQKENGAHILDVNVGMPEVDEGGAMQRAIETISVQAKLALSIDSSSVEVIEQALRIYPGRALVNSVSTKSDHIAQLLPLVKRYQPMFILLPIGDEGIPQTAEGRIKEIKGAYEKISSAGIGKESILVDGLVMTISSDPSAAIETLKVVKWCSDNGFYTVLGISNSSFGLPERKYINSAYLIMAMAGGLDCAIMNPSDKLMMDLYHAAEALIERDDNFEQYIKRFADTGISEQDAQNIVEAVLTGKKKTITVLIDKEIAKGVLPETVINEMIIPALKKVGDLYEQRIYFLPQLIYSAEAAKTAFDHLEKKYISSDAVSQKKKVVIATVKGDIHDIGKNLVAMLLRNHGFAVIDLGKDVAACTIVDTAEQEDADIIGLSALITTTAKEMEKVIALVKERKIRAKVMVGGAVITEEYAKSIGADAYGADAAGAVRAAAKLVEQ
ncbi:MAG: homocysteine S-methyltransferase family protein [Christensenellales bacterium]|jgi:5-methyltetrahydrofolate--homocysteine methyltransferase